MVYFEALPSLRLTMKADVDGLIGAGRHERSGDRTTGRKALVRQVHRREFMDATENVVLIDEPGTGKPHDTTALGIQTIEHSRHKQQNTIWACAWQIEFSTVERRIVGSPRPIQRRVPNKPSASQTSIGSLTCVPGCCIQPEVLLFACWGQILG